VIYRLAIALLVAELLDLLTLERPFRPGIDA